MITITAMPSEPPWEQEGPGWACQRVRATLAADRSAFAELYDRYAPLVRAVCYDATLDLTAAQDLAQETFLRAYRGLEGLKDPDRFAPWLIGIARRVCQEWQRGHRRDALVFRQPLEDATGAKPDVGDELDEVRRAVAELPEDERLAVHLFYLDEQGAEEARAVMSLSRSGFYKVLERARERLKRALTNEETLP